MRTSRVSSLPLLLLFLGVFIAPTFGDIECAQSELKTCTKCLEHQECGWSVYTQSCMNMDSGEPMVAYCPEYNYTADPCHKFESDCALCVEGSCAFHVETKQCTSVRGSRREFGKVVTNTTGVRECPYDPAHDRCGNTTDCYTCLTKLVGCQYMPETKTCVSSVNYPNSTSSFRTFHQCDYNATQDTCLVYFNSPITECERCITPPQVKAGCGWSPQDGACVNMNWARIPAETDPGYCPPTSCQYYSSCRSCTENQFCFWNSTTCVGWNEGKDRAGYTRTCPQNEEYCPYLSTCYQCRAYGDCTWAKDRCVGNSSPLAALWRHDTTECPYNRRSDRCAPLGRHCSQALVVPGCSFLKKNNTAVETRSLKWYEMDDPSILHDVRECPYIAADDRCGEAPTSNSCDLCNAHPACVWNQRDNICHGFNKRNSFDRLLVRVKEPCFDFCATAENCHDCSDLGGKNRSCSWSYLDNRCKPLNVSIFYSQVDPSVDASVAITCTTPPDVCDISNLEPYLCPDGYETRFFDAKNCHPTSVYRSSACIGGFFETNDTMANFWGTKNQTTTVRKCCPGYACPENWICTVKCPEGAFCPLSVADYPNVTVVDGPRPMAASQNQTAHVIVCDPFKNTMISPQLGCGGAPVALECEEGYYCPNTTAKLLCPFDHFCRTGSTAPISCYPPPFFRLLQIGIKCPPGSSRPETRVAAMFIPPLLLILLPFLYGGAGKLFGMFKQRQMKKAKSTKKHLLLSDSQDSDADMEIDRSSLSTTSSYQVADIDINTLYTIPVNPMDIQFDGLNVTLSNGAVILDDISGTFRSGRITAIMGPSGSGKTTLLSAVMGKVEYSGQVSPTISDIRTLIGFVPQEDVMHRELTVKENLMFSAAIRLPANLSRQSRFQIVSSAIEMLGLSAVQNSIVGDENRRGVSGGQRKRVNIGMELVSCPSVLFLDEPTSGLDSTMSLEVCHVLKKLTEVQVNVIAVIHQPRYDIFEQFDDILLLKKGGTLIYLGPREDVVSHFENQGYAFPTHQNPCDHFLDLISGPHKDDIKKNHVVPPQLSSTHPPERDTPNPFWQSLYIFIRASIQQWRQMTTIHSDLLLAIFSGVIVGLIYRNVQVQQIPQAAFLLVLCASMTSVVVSLRLFGNEKVVFWRESAAGMSGTAYFFGKNIASFPSYLVAVIFFLLFYYSLSMPRGDYLWYLGLLMTSHFCVSGMAHLLSIIMQPAKAQLFGVVVTLVQCAVCGFSPTLTSLKEIHYSLYIMARASFASWMMEALFIINTMKLTPVLHDERDRMLEIFGYDMSHLTLCFGILLVMGVIWRILSFLAIQFANRQQRK